MSRTLAVTPAIEEIATTFKRLEAEGTHASRAYFFMVGAGISTPQVKLASAIEEECRSAVPSTTVIPPEVDRNPMRRYSFWLEHAHPNRIQRQRYLRRMIENRAISAANFRLAHAIMSGHAPRLVVTANFDDFLTRALTLFGARPIVSDHPESAVRIDPESDDIQILHIHGTYWFYDCCNLDGEIRTRAETGAPHQNVSWRLGGILDRRSPIVLGYSGWEDDVFMRSLRARLDAPSGLPYNLYWFCYRRETIETLPRWLVDHADVCLVVPEAAPAASASSSTSRAGDDGGRDEQTAAERPEPMSERQDEPRLEAVAVLDHLNPALGLDEPELTRNPIGFFADHLRRSLLVGEGDDGNEGDDLYRLRWTVDQLSDMRSQWPSAREPVAGQGVADALLAQVQSAVRRSQHREAIAAARTIALRALTRSQLAELRKTVLLAAVGLMDDSEDELAGYDLVVAAGDLSAPDGDAEEVVTALLYRGLTLGQLDRSDEALAAYETLIDRHEDDPDRDIQRHVASAMRNKANALGKLDRNDEAIAAYDTLIARYATDLDRDVQRQVAGAMASKGYALGKLNRNDDAIAAYDTLIASYQDDPDRDIQRQVAIAMRNKGYALGKLNRSEEAIAVHDELINRWQHDPNPDIQRQVATAMVNKGFQLGKLNRTEEAIATYDDLVARYERHPDVGIQAQLAMGMFNKGSELKTHGRGEEAAAAYDALIERYAGSTDAKIAGLVADARRERAAISP